MRPSDLALERRRCPALRYLGRPPGSKDRAPGHATAPDIRMSDRVWFVYLLVCRNGHVYTGVTPDLDRRITAHRNGTGAKFTRGNPRGGSGKADAAWTQALTCPDLVN